VSISDFLKHVIDDDDRTARVERLLSALTVLLGCLTLLIGGLGLALANFTDLKTIGTWGTALAGVLGISTTKAVIRKWRARRVKSPATPPARPSAKSTTTTTRSAKPPATRKSTSTAEPSTTRKAKPPATRKATPPAQLPATTTSTPPAARRAAPSTPRRTSTRRTVAGPTPPPVIERSESEPEVVAD
jgi:hypothetical protein